MLSQNHRCCIPEPQHSSRREHPGPPTMPFIVGVGAPASGDLERSQTGHTFCGFAVNRRCRQDSFSLMVRRRLWPWLKVVGDAEADAVMRGRGRRRGVAIAQVIARHAELESGKKQREVRASAEGVASGRV